MNLWFTARGAGLSALVLLTISTSLGALMSRHGRASTRYVVQYVHRVTAALGVTVLTLHIGTILADSYAGVGWRGALIPFTSGYRPTWVALGSLAAYIFVGVALLGLVRGRMAASPRGARAWRGLHALAYVGWGSAMVHGYNSGTDTSVTWVRALYLVCLVAVIASVITRLVQVKRLASPGRTGADRFAHLEAARRETVRPVSQGASR